MRSKPETAHDIYQKYLINYKGEDTVIWAFCQRNALNLLLEDPDNWRLYLKTIESSYLNGSISESYFYEPARKVNLLSPSAAKHITKHPHKYPSALVTMAESVCRNDVAQKITPVGKVAKHDNWFA